MGYCAPLLSMRAGPQAPSGCMQVRRAAACMKLGRHADALADAETAVAADGAYPKGYLRRALAHQALGGLDSLEQAVRDFERVRGVSSWLIEGIWCELEQAVRNARPAQIFAFRRPGP